MSNPRFVILSGPAASGKTTLALSLATNLGLPLLSKDGIKAALRAMLDRDILPMPVLGDVAVATLLQVAAHVRLGAVIDTVWRRDQADGLNGLPGARVEVFCHCPRPLLEARYAARVRPAGYAKEHASTDELWSPETMIPIGRMPVIQVDTSGLVDLGGIADQVARLLEAGHLLAPDESNLNGIAP